jgi:hypothetical protein
MRGGTVLLGLALALTLCAESWAIVPWAVVSVVGLFSS